jgi:hypothetical protein
VACPEKSGRRIGFRAHQNQSGLGDDLALVLAHFRGLPSARRLTAYPMFLSILLILLRLQVGVRMMSAYREAARMQAETQNQPITTPENAPQSESVESKSLVGLS